MKSEAAIILFTFIILTCSFGAGQSDQANESIRLGWEHIKKMEYDMALKNFEEATLLDPSNSEAWYGKGYAINGLGGMDYTIAEEGEDADKYVEAENYFNEAKKAFEKAIQLNSSNYKAYIHMAWSESMLRNFEKALELIDKALEISPNNAEAINVKGTIYYRTSDYRKAAELYRKAVTLDPENPDAWWDYCDVLKNELAGDPRYVDETDTACKKSAELEAALIGHES